jgi:hypothetical protein
MSRLVVGLGNFATKLRRTRVRPDQLLVLFPICLQCSQCPHNLMQSVENCQRCGKCKVSDLRALAEKYGCRVQVAAGGRLALKLVKDPEVKGVVAVACSKELRTGMLAAFPKAVIGVVNIFTGEPCKDTDVNIDAVERAIRWFLRD